MASVSDMLSGIERCQLRATNLQTICIIKRCPGMDVKFSGNERVI
jgi:hypothetical protein